MNSKRKTIPTLLAAAIILAGCGAPDASIAPVPYAADSGSLVVRCGLLIDGLQDEPLPYRLVIIEDGRIASISVDTGDAPSGLPVLDLTDYTCMPGLINAHVHLDSYPEDAADYSVYYKRTADDNNDIALDVAATTLQTGFTTVRNVGTWFPDAIVFAREQIRAGKAPGPRIRTAGPYLTIPGGGGDLTFPEIPPDKIPPESQTGIASTPEEFGERAAAAIANGADFLKVIASGAVFSVGTDPGAPEMSQADIEAVVKEARAAGIKVTAHVHSTQSGKDAILAGVDSLEHASLLDDETIALAAEHDVALSMDVYNGTYTDTVGREQGYPEVFLQRNFDTTEAQRVVFEKAYAKGVTILYGTDASVLPHDMGGWQFGIMVERGMAPMDALKSATSVPAEHMGLADDIGALEAGRFGDLVAVKGNPLADMAVMKDVAAVIKGGLVFKRP